MASYAPPRLRRDAATTELTAGALGVVSVERAALVTDPHTGDLRVYVPVLRTGLAVSHDLTTVHDTTPNGPLYGAHSTDSETGVEDFATLRYLAVDSVAKDGGSGTTHDAYYEAARADGAFELQRAPIEFDQS